MIKERAPFRTDDLVPASGIYRIYHRLHDLQDTVALFRGERFPKCCMCDRKVLFVLTRATMSLDLLPNLSVPSPLLELHARGCESRETDRQMGSIIASPDQNQDMNGES